MSPSASVRNCLLICMPAALLLAACGGAAAPAGDSVTGAISARAPAATATQTPAPEPSATPEPTSVPFIDPADWPAAEPGAISVDAGQRHGPISPLVYGTNKDPAMIVTVDLFDAATQEMGIRFVRFPAGNYGDTNNILPGAYDDFIELTGDLGAEPNIHVRVVDRTAADAAETVRLVNEELGHDVRYWAIGNEPALFYNDFHDAESYAAMWREFALAMKEVDPDILMIGPEITQFATEELAWRSDVARAREWMRAFLETNGDLVDVVTVHRYPFPTSMPNPNVSIEELRPTSAEFDVSMRELRAMIREITGRDIPVGVTEVNTESSRGFSGEASPDSPFAAIWLADVLGRLIRQDAAIVAQYAFQTRDSRGAWGLLARDRVRPQYYVYQLYKRFGSELIYAATDDELVTAYAALRDDGALTLMAINRGDEAAEKTLRLSANTPQGTTEVFRIDETNLVDLPAAPDGREVMEPVELIDGATITVPPRSVTLYVVAAGQ